MPDGVISHQEGQIHLVSTFVFTTSRSTYYDSPTDISFGRMEVLTVIFFFFPLSLALNSRPIAGHANLCPRSISTKLPELDVLISTVKHEILHALGFSVSLFAFYRDSKGSPLTPRDEHGKPALNEK